MVYNVLSCYMYNMTRVSRNCDIVFFRFGIVRPYSVDTLFLEWDHPPSTPEKDGCKTFTK